MSDPTQNSPATSTATGLKDAIVTLPAWALTLISFLCFGVLGLSIYFALYGKTDAMKAASVQLLVVLVPLGTAVLAAIAIRRTSTRDIDRLIAAFLEKTLLERFQIWCDEPSPQTVSKTTQTLKNSPSKPQGIAFPFSRVKLVAPTMGKSYAQYVFESAVSPYLDAPQTVSVKTNVFNFEVFANLSLPAWLGEQVLSAQAAEQTLIIGAKNLEIALQNPIVAAFHSVIQGSVNEGYEVNVSYRTQATQTHNEWFLSFSFRQKLQSNFLTSAFLKRYFAEDAAILVRVLFNEYAKVLQAKASSPKNTELPAL